MQLHRYDFFDLIFVQRRKHNRFIDTVQELGTYRLFQQIENLILGLFGNFLPVGIGKMLEIFTYQLRSHIGGHDNNRIFEINQSAFIIGQPTIIENL